MYLGVRSPLMGKSYFAQNWTYTLFVLSGRNLVCHMSVGIVEHSILQYVLQYAFAVLQYAFCRIVAPLVHNYKNMIPGSSQIKQI